MWQHDLQIFGIFPAEYDARAAINLNDYTTKSKTCGYLSLKSAKNRPNQTNLVDERIFWFS
jgi:hypothetical protein